MAVKACSIPGCGRPVLNVRGWCNRHYLRWQRHGDPLGGKNIDYGAAERDLERAIAEATPDACWTWSHTLNPTGYPSITLNRLTQRVNRLVCKRVHGDPPTPAHQAAHNCGNRKCINPHHLEWKTRKENEADKLLHGTHQRGERSHAAKLNEAQVREIFALRKRGLTMRQLSEQFGVAHSTIQSILERRNWQHLEEIEA